MVWELVEDLDGHVQHSELQFRLGEDDRALLLRALSVWARLAYDLDAFVWLSGPELRGALAVGDSEAQFPGAALHDGMLRLSLATIRSAAHDSVAIVDRYLEVIGQRVIDGHPTAWRVRPGAWLRRRLRAGVDERTTQSAAI
jgi:hypothetical protein